ncbi:MAG: rod shape-determining protein MreC, partial [Nitrospirae bacterium]|nr:rod shape-determining protein MreC [Nitrospirota bacterium]
MPLKKRFLAFLFIVLLIVILLTYQGIKGSAGFYPAFDFLIFPLKGVELAGSSMSSGIKNLFERYFPGSGRADEIRNLREKIRELEQERNKFAETQAENERLRDLLELKSGRQDYVATAGVIARDPANWFQILWINKGSEKGIDKNMVAVTASGIVGRVH